MTALLVYDGNSVFYKLEDNFPENGYYNNKCYYAIDGFGMSGEIGEGTSPIGEGSIFRYDFETLSASSTTYAINEIPSMITTGQEVLILKNTCKFIKYGLREFDARPIIVEIDAETGGVNVIESEMGQKIHNLVRIN